MEDKSPPQLAEADFGGSHYWEVGLQLQVILLVFPPKPTCLTRPGSWQERVAWLDSTATSSHRDVAMAHSGHSLVARHVLSVQSQPESARASAFGDKTGLDNKSLTGGTVKVGHKPR